MSDVRIDGYKAALHNLVYCIFPAEELMLKICWRYCAVSAVASFGVLSCVSSQAAQDNRDYFSTNQYVASGPFVRSSEVCAKDKIQQPLLLPDVVELALCNNPQTHSLWAATRAQAAQLGVSMSSYLPTLSSPISVSGSSTGSGTVTTTTSASLTISYLLFDFGGREANVENAKQLLLAANATRDEALQTLFLTAVQSYFNLLSTRASVESFKAAESAAQTSLDAATARYNAGSNTPADRLQAQTALSQARLNRIRAEGDAASAQGTLANVMGFEANQPFVLAPTPEPTADPVAEQEVGRLIEGARRNRPDLVAAEAQIKAAEAEVSATRAAGLPTVTLNGSISRFDTRGGGISSTSHSNSVGVTLSVPWFTGFSNTYQKRVAQAQLEGKVADRDRVANQIALDVWNAYQALLTNSQALRSADDLLASATQSEKMASGRYKAGLGSILDVLTAQSALASAQQQRVAALYTYQTSRFALTQAIGELDLTQLGNNN